MAQETSTKNVEKLKNIQGKVDRWEELWQNKVFPWHINEINPKLMKHFALLKEQGQDQVCGENIFVIWKEKIKELPSFDRLKLNCISYN